LIHRNIALAVLAFSMGLGILVLNFVYPPDLARYEDLSRTVVAKDGSTLRAFTSSDDMWRFPVTIEDVDPRYIEFLIAYEDKRFWSHYGVDPLSVARAIVQRFSEGQVISGASTITMQVARLLEPRPRTLLSKGIEMARAIQLEMRFSKKEILSVYLTLAPFGGNLEGVRAASLAYFNKPPRNLTIAETALLVALPQSPTVVRPDRNQNNARVARLKVLERLKLAGIVSSLDLEEAEETKVSGGRYRYPFLAPHLARRLQSRGSGGVNIQTNIISDYQMSAREIISEAVRLSEPGVNAAAIVIENETANVLAYVASNDFFDTSRLGQIDYIRAIRSPGSALKPFIYAMAFDEGLAHPETILTDRTKRFGGYRPTNFDGISQGLITARYALQASLNVSAVILLNEIGPRRFLSHIQNVGVRLKLRSAGSSPGLAVALGGVGVSLEQLVTMYVALARGGSFKELSFTKGDEAKEARHFFDPETTSLVFDVLKGTPRPLGRSGRRDKRKIAYKTGTSSGNRDVLALGFNKNYTVGVWMGHPRAKPMTGKTGARTAAPLLFKIFDILPTHPVEGPASLEILPVKKTPKSLRKLQVSGEEAKGANSKPFSISFPVEGTRIPLRQRRFGPLTVFPIKLRDGKRPFSIFVNDRLMRSSNLTRSIPWSPKEPGFYSITAVDREGIVATSRVELSEN
jgi:penicillin-binding protein 1C